MFSWPLKAAMHLHSLESVRIPFNKCLYMCYDKKIIYSKKSTKIRKTQELLG